MELGRVTGWSAVRDSQGHRPSSTGLLTYCARHIP
nr:hypothetical protein [Streptomyces sulphureus]